MTIRGFFRLIGSISILLSNTGCYADKYFHPISNADMFKVSVEITNFEKDSGGSGVILSSDKSGSIILTNRHVCRLVEHGGLVNDPAHVDHQVIAYKEAPDHDLCLIKINDNLDMNIRISDAPPKLGDDAIIAGHPALLPLIVTRGMFSEHMVIQIEDGDRDCTEVEKLDPNTGMRCALIDKMPVIISREAQVVSATIMPGSSGSPVFDDKGNLKGLVFAGSQGLSYALIVPLEAVHMFMQQQKEMGWSKTQ